MSKTITPRWWKEVVAYQIYPRSFKDTNGDGIGDLNGVAERLDYLKELGIDLIWLCPIFKSPNDDNGYDISDYQAIMDEFGTMADFDRLLREVHARGMRLILDLVVNHTSDEHPWFLESRSSQDNPKRDWYIWRDGKSGKEPNNWESIFKESAWKWDAQSGQYFMHLFSGRQPDLNWDNKGVRHAVYEMIRWWLDKGIDGFRIDAISHMKKEAGLDDMPNPQQLEYVPSLEKHLNVDGVLDYLDDICRNTFSHYDIMTVGEANGVSAEQADDWVAERHNRLNMLIQFEHVKLWDNDTKKPLDLCALKAIFSRWQEQLHGVGWNALYVENHDIPRIISKWGDSERFWRESATSIAAMYFLMQGTPFIYQGQEIGMTNTSFSSLDDFNDVSAKNLYRKMKKEGFSDRTIIDLLSLTSRDNSRTPMQWDNSTNAGFSTAAPWIKVNPNYITINVRQQQEQPDSILNFYRRMIQLRKDEKVLVYGDYGLLMAEDPQIYAYTRSLEGQHAVIICNMSASEAQYRQQDILLEHHNLRLNNYPVPPHEPTSQFKLKPYETRTYLVD
ncbi:glycoside hydrolase family 13 protein [Klebsiella pneumoniae]|nr:MULTISPECIES: alpha-glucosidase [Enterobacteriaceae]HEE0912660.1 alpha-glucosidase [Klebsiella pneumoniae]AOV15630.1 glucohydrolase [Klebsiella sp. LTGPAF-6F]ELD2092658.1 alpha-glucosidase [Enterobacter hormaechei]ELJ6259110.1 alpha-glucosidase [Klebsiella michiganensis]MBO2808795.1 alpha-glucosidase [Enterobacter hormaechei]